MNNPVRISLLALVLAVLLSSFAIGQTGREETLSRARIATPAAPTLAKQLEEDGYDVVRTGDTELEVVASREELDQLRQRGLDVQILERGRPLQEILQSQTQIEAVPANYRDLNGILNRMQEIAAANPSIARFVDLTATFGAPATVQGRRLFALKISDNAGSDEDEPAVLIVSAHHAREINTPVVALDAAERLVNGYGVDSRITAAVNSNEIWIAPVWNPDGYNHVFVADNLWRKNRRVFANGTGVDQNRNYPQGWASACAGSTTVSSETYKGPSAGSEAETRAMMTWSQAVRFAKVLDFHSFGRDTRFGYQCTSHPFDAFFRQEAVSIGQAVNYTTSRSVANGEHPQWQFARIAALTVLLEIGTAFQPSFSSATAEAARVWPGILRMLERPVPLSGRVTDAATGAPLAATLTFLNVTFQNGETYNSGGAFGAYHVFAPSGTYSIRFSAPGFISETRTVTVNSAAATVLNVALRR
jgi:carboxypeptidase T